MRSSCLWDSPGNTPVGAGQGLLLEYVGAEVTVLSLNGVPTEPSPLTSLNILQDQDWLCPPGNQEELRDRRKRREGEGCSWEQYTCMSLQGQHADTECGQSYGVTSSAQDICTSSQDHHGYTRHNVQRQSARCGSAQDCSRCSCSTTCQEQRG